MNELNIPKPKSTNQTKTNEDVLHKRTNKQKEREKIHTLYQRLHSRRFVGFGLIC